MGLKPKQNSQPNYTSPPLSSSLTPRGQAAPTHPRKIKAVILESPQGFLSLREIYEALEVQPSSLAPKREDGNVWTVREVTVRSLLSLSPAVKEAKVRDEKSCTTGPSFRFRFNIAKTVV